MNQTYYLDRCAEKMERHRAFSITRKEFEQQRLNIASLHRSAERMEFATTAILYESRLKSIKMEEQLLSTLHKLSYIAESIEEQQAIANQVQALHARITELGNN